MANLVGGRELAMLVGIGSIAVSRLEEVRARMVPGALGVVHENPVEEEMML